jgi:hypothetical protein
LSEILKVYFKKHFPTKYIAIIGILDRAKIGFDYRYFTLMGRAHTTEENGKWGETKQRSENQVAFNCVLGPS